MEGGGGGGSRGGGGGKKALSSLNFWLSLGLVYFGMLVTSAIDSLLDDDEVNVDVDVSNIGLLNLIFPMTGLYTLRWFGLDTSLEVGG